MDGIVEAQDGTANRNLLKGELVEQCNFLEPLDSLELCFKITVLEVVTTDSRASGLDPLNLSRQYVRGMCQLVQKS